MKVLRKFLKFCRNLFKKTALSVRKIIKMVQNYLKWGYWVTAKQKHRGQWVQLFETIIYGFFDKNVIILLESQCK